MIIICVTCLEKYDDVYRLTYCPHDSFPCSPSAAILLYELGVDPGPIED